MIMPLSKRNPIQTTLRNKVLTSSKTKMLSNKLNATHNKSQFRKLIRTPSKLNREATQQLVIIPKKQRHMRKGFRI